jgi:uncharacterized protein YcfJ
MSRYIITLALTGVIVVAGSFIAGCETQGQTDAALGTAAGAGIGAIVGHQSGHATQGALIGGAVGGGTGYIVGNEADKKQQNVGTRGMQQETGSVVVNIHNSNGSVTPVRLTRSGAGYTGPRGEVYDHFPTEAELKPVYGF